MTKTNLVGSGRSFAYLSSSSQFIHEEYEAGIQAEKQQKQKTQRNAANQLAPLDHTQRFILYKLGPPALLGAVCSGQGSPTSIINQDNVPTGLPIGQSDGVNSSPEVPSLISLVCASLTNINKQSSHLQ